MLQAQEPAPKSKRNSLSRRTFLAAGLTVALSACAKPSPASPAPGPQPHSVPDTTTVTPAAGQILPATPSCGQEAPTVAQTEGPYYTTNTPLRTSLLEPGMVGTKLLLMGYVMTQGCKPVANALVDFWQADAVGVYDNQGFRLRGHQFTDEAGRYLLETIVPGNYPGRTRHIHVKVQAPNGSPLTTQLYFPGEAQNATDRIYNKDLLMEVTDSANGKAALFTFVLRGA